jgi:hypothetical protein
LHGSVVFLLKIEDVQGDGGKRSIKGEQNMVKEKI